MNIAFLGTGLMGYPMVERLLEAGHTVTVYNRTAEKAKPLERKGAKVLGAAQGAIDQSDCIILMLSDVWAIEEVLSPQDNEDLADKTVIQMGTIAPSESLSVHTQVTRHGGEYLECPVLGSRREAAHGELILMVGSTMKQFEEWRKLLEAFGPDPRHIGEVGKAAALKLALNQLIASHAAGFSLSLGIVEKNEISEEIFMSILKKSALFAPMFEKKLPNWRERNYANPNFPVKHLLKDVELILKEAEGKGLSTDVIEGIRKILEKTIENGLGDQDYSAIYEEINKI